MEGRTYDLIWQRNPRIAWVVQASFCAIGALVLLLGLIDAAIYAWNRSSAVMASARVVTVSGDLESFGGGEIEVDAGPYGRRELSSPSRVRQVNEEFDLWVSPTSRWASDSDWPEALPKALTPIGIGAVFLGLGTWGLVRRRKLGAAADTRSRS